MVHNSTEEWCRQQLANLHVAERRISTLSEIRTHLASSPESSNWLTLRDIFDCIEDNSDNSGTEQTHLACDILSICMTNLSIKESENQHYLMRCLQHPNGDVQLIAINEIERNLGTFTKDGPLDATIVIALLESVKHPTEKVAWSAIAILTKALSRSLSDPSVRSNLAKCLESSELVQCRVFDLAVRVAKQSPDDLELIEFILSALYEALETEDVLKQLNVLDLLGDLALSDHGFVYLENKGIFTKVSRHLQTLEDNPLRGLLVPGYFKFFGTISSVQPKRIIDGFSHLILALFQTIIDMDMVQLPVALDTLGHLTRSNEGTVLLHEKYSDQLQQALSKIGSYIRNLPTPLQTRTLNCLEIMFQPETVPPNNQVSSIVNVWLNWLTGANNLNFLLDFCRNPFPEIQLAAVTLLSAVCAHPWGIRAVSETAGFVEHLLDRHAEFDKDVKQEKYLVIKTLTGASGVGCFDAQTTADLKRYVEEGAFYVTGMVDVAVEGST